MRQGRRRCGRTVRLLANQSNQSNQGSANQRVRGDASTRAGNVAGSVTPPRIRLGWMSIRSEQWAHFAVPFSATSVEFDLPQLRHFQVLRELFIRETRFLAENRDGNTGVA